MKLKVLKLSSSISSGFYLNVNVQKQHFTIFLIKIKHLHIFGCQYTLIRDRFGNNCTYEHSVLKIIIYKSTHNWFLIIFFNSHSIQYSNVDVPYCWSIYRSVFNITLAGFTNLRFLCTSEPGMKQTSKLTILVQMNPWQGSPRPKAGYTGRALHVPVS